MTDDTRRAEAERAWKNWGETLLDGPEGAHAAYRAGFIAGDANGYARGKAAGRAEILGLLEEIAQHDQRKALELGNAHNIWMATLYAGGRDLIRAAIKDIEVHLAGEEVDNG